MHHSKTDEIVKIDGCCNTNKCKAGISDRSNECVSVKEEWMNWMKWNQCDMEKYNITWDNLKVYEDRPKHGRFECAFAGKLEHECNADTRLCLHEQTPHSQWAKKFPLTQDVMIWFLKVLCDRNGGKWDDGSNLCVCDGENVGIYCENLKADLEIDWVKLSNYKRSWMDKDGVDAYLQVDENERHVKKKRPLIQKWKDRKIPKNIDHDHVVPVYKHREGYMSEADKNFWKIIKGTMVIVGFVCGLICVGIWCKVYRDKYKVKYKLLPREDEDIEGGVDGNHSDSSNYSHNNGVVRNRSHK